MAYSKNWNGYVAAKAQSTKVTPASGSGASDLGRAGTVAAGDDIRLRITVDRSGDAKSRAFERFVSTTAALTATVAYSAYSLASGGICGGLFSNGTAVTDTVAAEINCVLFLL